MGPIQDFVIFLFTCCMEKNNSRPTFRMYQCESPPPYRRKKYNPRGLPYRKNYNPRDLQHIKI